MIKAVFFDIDGTLIPFDTGILPESTKDSIRMLREKGIKTYIATGKSLPQLRQMTVMEADFDGYMTLNGQLCYDGQMEMYCGTPIDNGEMQVLAQMFKAKRIPFHLLGESSSYINYVNDLVVEKRLGTNADVPNVGEYCGEKIYQITAFVKPRERTVLEGILDLCKVTAWDEQAVDIIAADGGKAQAVKKILELLGYDRSEAMAFGDAENDIEMLRFVGTGVAMGNATDKVKAVADYVTTDIHCDGIKNALKHFGVI